MKEITLPASDPPITIVTRMIGMMPSRETMPPTTSA